MSKSIPAKTHSSTILLSPGEVIFSDKALQVKTILGSCVAITIWHPNKFGGLCHFLIANKHKTTDTKTTNYRYGEDALHFLYMKMSDHAPVHEYELRLFGGANMYASNTSPTVGENNVAYAKHWAKQHNLNFTQQDILGKQSRSLFFDLRTGNVCLQQYQQGHHHDH